MFENLGHKNKFYILLGLTLVLAITAYKRSYVKAIEAYDLLQESRHKIATINDSKKNASSLKADVAYLDDIIGKEAANPEIVQQEVLKSFSEMDTKAELVKLEEVHQAKNDYFNIYSNRLLLSGSYESLLKATYAFERDFEYSRVVSIAFYTERNYRTRQKKLFEQIIFQNYEKIK